MPSAEAIIKTLAAAAALPLSDPVFCSMDQADRYGDRWVARRAAAPMNAAQWFRTGSEGDYHLQLSHT